MKPDYVYSILIIALLCCIFGIQIKKDQLRLERQMYLYRIQTIELIKKGDYTKEEAAILLKGDEYLELWAEEYFSKKQ